MLKGHDKKYIWEVWSKQHPRKLYYYSLAEVRLAKLSAQECGHTKVYTKRKLK